MTVAQQGTSVNAADEDAVGRHTVMGNSHRVTFDLDWFALGADTKAIIWMRLSSGRHAGPDGMCYLRDATQVIYWLPRVSGFGAHCAPAKAMATAAVAFGVSSSAGFPW